MTPEEILSILSVAGKLKKTWRHCETEPGRKESVAEHSWRIALMAMLLRGIPEFEGDDLDRVVRMCLIHDLGEAFTGDIPTFMKTEEEGKQEEDLFQAWISRFPEPQRSEWTDLLKEMEEQQTREARIYKSLDRMEALISHNESELSSWLPLEYDLQYSYGQDTVRFSEFLTGIRGAIDDWSTRKIREEGRE